MNRYIKNTVEKQYQIDLKSATKKEIDNIKEINVSDLTMDKDASIWDFSDFHNLVKLDCSYLPITELITKNCPNLEYLRWEGVRGAKINIDITKNCKLKKVRGGQDGIRELDFSNNILLEEIDISLSHYLRWLDISSCSNLKRITLFGVLIPFVDLTGLHNLEYVNISYLNQYRNMADVYGNGYPRPIIFVDEDFDENIIDPQTHMYSYYTYKLIRVAECSRESSFLYILKNMKDEILSIQSDSRGSAIAEFHYRLLEIYDNIE